ncbi:MAG: hypothetical protein NC916_02670 [Candidatus Omnitrophica bacterium]|nr:hypothetical protein [Candidatus Omnitrophota bacterium]
MKKRINIAFLVFLFSVVFPDFIFCEEGVTLTTYYPSPQAVYKNLRVYPSEVSAGESCREKGAGTLAYSDSDNQLLYCDGNKWQPQAGGAGGFCYETYSVDKESCTRTTDFLTTWECNINSPSICLPGFRLYQPLEKGDTDRWAFCAVNVEHQTSSSDRNYFIRYKHNNEKWGDEFEWEAEAECKEVASEGVDCFFPKICVYEGIAYTKKVYLAQRPSNVGDFSGNPEFLGYGPFYCCKE